MSLKLSCTSRKVIFAALLLLLITPLAATKYAGEIFHYGMGVRNLALGSTGLTNLDSHSIAWWNPALLQFKTENSMEIMHAEEFEGLLQYDTFSAIWGKDKKFSIVLSRIGINDIPLTALENDSLAIGNDNRPYAYDYVNNSDLVAYFGFYQQAGSLTLGFTPKIAYRSLADESGFGFGADLAIVTDPTKKLVLAAQIRDFFTTRIFWNNGTDEAVVPNANLEASYGFDFPFNQISMRFYLRPEILFEGREEAATISFDPVSIDLHAGLESHINQHFDFLLGYDIDHLTAGLALKYQQFGLSYCFEMEPELDNSHRIALNWSY
ncbi:MAG: hypothetical protein RAO94_03060 [Candidatus Stygibacter australis]|nr:hypothetical protein [Candidatus Stygibacter australis]MDP8321314.1 hypothetical protein [Candidatus Stygibacter australis]